MAFDPWGESKDSWGIMIKQEIIDLKIRMSAIEAQLKDMGAQTTPSGGISTGGGRGRDVFGHGETSIFDREAEWDEAHQRDTTTDLVHATYTIRSASTAMRGYMMMVDQAGLSKDQKKMIREMEYTAMMALKAATAIQYAAKAMELAQAGTLTGPLGAMYAVLTGGSIAASVAFGSKLGGGGV